MSEGPAGLGQTLFGEELVLNLVKPYGVAVDREGRVYVSDVGRVFVFDKKNRKLSFLGGEAGTGRLRTPIGIAIAPDGRVYVTDTASDKTFVYDGKGNFVTAIGQKEEFEGPSGLAIDEKRGRLYVADTKKHNVRAYSFDGRLLMTRIWTTTACWWLARSSRPNCWSDSLMLRQRRPNRR